MKGWEWLTSTKYSWAFGLRVVIRALLLFAVFNLLWLALDPLPGLARLSVYGWLVPYRDRLPYGESPAASNLSTDSLEAMFATHELNRPKAADEFRVIVLGDSATWGILLGNPQTTTGLLNKAGATVGDRRVVYYNVGHPIMSLTKDLLLLDRAQQYQPDLVIWLTTLESFYRPEQMDPPIVRNNAPRVRELATRYGLTLALETLPETTLLERSFIGQRRLIADWWRLQGYGLAWATTGVDQVYPTYQRVTNDFEADLLTWKAFTEPTDLEPALAFDVIAAAHTMLGAVPILLVNEPIYQADGRNHDVRYNVWYPRWAYDQYRSLYAQQAAANGWAYTDLWDAIASGEFTDSPVHLTPAGSATLAGLLQGLVE